MSAKRTKSSKKLGAGRTQGSLPALSSLLDVPAFEQLIPSSDQTQAYTDVVSELEAQGVSRQTMTMACVVRLDRGFPAVVSEQGVFRAEFAARVTKGQNSTVAVGDWVCARIPDSHDMGIIEAILPRETDIARWKGGARGQKQTLAANVDLVLVVQALDGEAISVDRIVRSAVISKDCGATCAVVLTKSDVAGPELLAQEISSITAALGSTVKIVATASKLEGEKTDALADLAQTAQKLGAAWGIDAVRSLVPYGSVAIVLGESGAGKSTLLNALLGHEALETGEVRESDKAGRHTTVARRMVALPDAGVIVDEPGLRSLPIVGHERGLQKIFPYISEAAQTCKFRDCTHTHEPGCSVQDALHEGKITEPQLKAYLSLAKEMRESQQSLDPDVVL